MRSSRRILRAVIDELGAVPFGLLVWNTGLAPNPLIQSIKELQKDEKTKRCAYPLHPSESELISDVAA